MGYYSRFTGQINIVPPLTWKEIQANPWLREERDLRIELDIETVQVDEGTLERKSGCAIVPLTDDTYKGYSARSFIEAVAEAFPDREFTGQILREGEEAGDIARLMVKDGLAIEQQATFTFPEELT